MTNNYQTQRSAGRATEIYKYALSQEGRSFAVNSIPEWRWTVANKTAMGLLTSNGLLKLVTAAKPQRYVVARTVNPVDCLNVDDAADKAANITRYRVPIGLLDRLGGEPGLINHKIKA